MDLTESIDLGNKIINVFFHAEKIWGLVFVYQDTVEVFTLNGRLYVSICIFFLYIYKKYKHLSTIIILRISNCY